MSAPKPEPVFTVGHSNHEAAQFIGLLKAHRIEIVADVRSTPQSSYLPQFNQDFLRGSLERSGIKYWFLGRELGGRPRGEAFYDSEGHVLYGEVATAPFFISGLQQIAAKALSSRVALMCSEEDPRICHRHLLVAGEALKLEPPIDMLHIRKDSSLLPESLLAGEYIVRTLFGEEDNRPCRSLRSVLRKSLQRTSSSESEELVSADWWM